MKAYDHKKKDPSSLKLRTGKKKMAEYNHSKIESKWQKEWEKKGVYHAQSPSPKASARYALARARRADRRKKFYSLIEFPYPSGDGLHVGHPRPYIGMDIISRKRRMEGFNVLYPIGWDAFGLPTENYAIKTGKDPRVVTKKNTDTFRKQIKSLGISFDWSREINTTDPKYYKWTQWIFLQFLKKGLAYKAKMMINWCPKDKIGLANEEVIAGACERCGTVVEKREKEQWMLAITKYADRLYKDLDEVDYLPQIKLGQRNWIGKSEGVNFKCKIKDLGIAVEMYNSVPQTFRAETFTVIAPEHDLVPKLVAGTKYEKPVLDFVEKLNKKRSRKDFDAEKEMEGIFTGRYIENFAGSGRDLPIWIASYVVADYGTGIVNASAHDTRDFAFAKKFNIPLHPVAEALYIRDINPELPMVERDAITALVEHWSEKKYLILKWKKAAWHTFITGGIEKGQTPEESAKREILEETGYLHPCLIKYLGIYHSKFYHEPKKENRFGHFRTFHFKLSDGEKQIVTEDEKDKHEALWMTKEEALACLHAKSMQEILLNLEGEEKPVVKNGILTEPVEFKGREWGEVREDIINYIVKNGWAERKVNYKLRDWIFSRQRYWGEPIPVVRCLSKGSPCSDTWVPVPEKDLPVKLPKVKNYQPTESGESPLANIAKWVNVKCPKCKGKGKRETDTMPNWAGSSWYYLRYTDSKNNKEFASKENLKYWLTSPQPSPEKRGGNMGGVDWYNGGNEHTTLHLLYSRFWHKFLFDLGLVPTSEPYKKRTSHGMILGEGGVKMSKSLGNVINPDDIVKTYGADTLRVYEMFMGPFDQSVAWSTESIIGARRFIEKVWRIGQKISENQKNFSGPRVARAGVKDKSGLNQTVQNSSSFLSLEKLLHKTIKKVSEDIEEMRFNTAISSMMILATEMEKAENISIEDFKMFLKILSPFAPHITEELWSVFSEKKSISFSDWPKYDENLMKDEEIKIVVQINGKVRAEIIIQTDEGEEDVKKKALSNQIILKHIAGRDIQRTIYVKNRLINIVLAV